MDLLWQIADLQPTENRIGLIVILQYASSCLQGGNLVAAGTTSTIGTGGAIPTYTRAVDEVCITMRRAATNAACKGPAELSRKTLRRLLFIDSVSIFRFY